MISNRAVSALAVQLGGEEKTRLTKRYTENVEAYGLYLKGRFHAGKLRPPDIQTGISYLQQAIETDPSYALASVGLAEDIARCSAGEMPGTELFPKAKAAAQKAIEIDDALAEAHPFSVPSVFWDRLELEEAENQYQRALELNPNCADTHPFYAHLLSNTGPRGRTRRDKTRQRARPTFFVERRARRTISLFHAGRTEEALARLQKTLKSNRIFGFLDCVASSAYIEKGMFTGSRRRSAAGERTFTIQTTPVAFGGTLWRNLGKREEARAVLEELLSLSTASFRLALQYRADL